MKHSHKIHSAMICILAAAASPALAQSWNPVSSDPMNNTAMGNGALANPNLDSDGGCHNTASGAEALNVDTSGSYNTATGYDSMASNLTGSYNTGFGSHTLQSNTSGQYNTASGSNALYYNTSGDDNAAAGYHALYSNTVGNQNTAAGTGSLSANSTGSNNIALGYNAGSLITGSNNIAIGNPGAAADSGTIRIGAKGKHKAAYIEGIYATALEPSSLPVYVNAAGRLSVGTSSERYKTAISAMGASTEKLQQLRPVSFHFKNDPKGALQYGLIAEEVAKVYPELVIRDGTGQIRGVRYDELAPMLLNEMQKQQGRIAAQDARIQAQAEQLAELKQMNQSMQAAVEKLLAREARVAMR